MTINKSAPAISNQLVTSFSKDACYFCSIDTGDYTMVNQATHIGTYASFFENGKCKRPLCSKHAENMDLFRNNLTKIQDGGTWKEYLLKFINLS